jgi:hypothetical protein
VNALQAQAVPTVHVAPGGIQHDVPEKHSAPRVQSALLAQGSPRPLQAWPSPGVHAAPGGIQHVPEEHAAPKVQSASLAQGLPTLVQAPPTHSPLQQLSGPAQQARVSPQQYLRLPGVQRPKG